MVVENTKERLFSIARWFPMVYHRNFRLKESAIACLRPFPLPDLVTDAVQIDGKSHAVGAKPLFRALGSRIKALNCEPESCGVIGNRQMDCLVGY